MPTYKIGLEDGRSLNIDADDQEAALAGAQHFIEHDKPSGIGAGFAHGAAGVASGIADTLGLAGVNTDAVKAGAAKIEPSNYKSASILRDGFRAIPQVIAEQAPGLGADLLVAKAASSLPGNLVSKAALGTGGFLGSMLLRTFGPGAHENAKARTGDENAEVTGADMAREGVKQALMAPINATAAGRFLPGANKVAGVGLEGAGQALKKYLTTAAVETAAGGGRDAVNQAVTNVGQDHDPGFDPKRSLEAALDSGVTSGAMVAPRLAAETASATKFRKFGGDNAEAATALANRQLEAADGKKLVGPIGGTKTAAEAVAAAHKDVHTELSDAAKGEDDLSINNNNTLKRIQSGGKATNAELNELATEASPETVHLARQALLSARLKDMGEFTDKKFTGGISGMMEDKLRALYNPTAAVASMGAAALGLPAMIGLSPHIVAGTYGAYGAARVLDKLTGARSPAQGFTAKFADANAPVRTPVAVPAAPAPVSTSVPQVTPPQNTALWGNPTAEPASLRSTLNTNVKLEEGMAKIAARLAAEKKKNMIASAMPALQQLAAQQKPVTADEPAPAPALPEFNPTLMKMVKDKIKQGLPPEPVPAPPPAPPAPEPLPQFNPTLMKMIKEKMKQGLPPEPVAAPPPPPEAPQLPQYNPTMLSMLKAKLKAGLPPEAPPVAQTAPVAAAPVVAPPAAAPMVKKRTTVLPAGFASSLPSQRPAPVGEVSNAPASPAIGALLDTLRAKQAAMAPAAPAAAPAAPASMPASAPPLAPEMPQPPLIAKITKKMAEGPVKETPHPEAEQPYAPKEDLWRKGLSDQDVAAKALSEYEPAERVKYSKTIIENRAAHRTALEAIAHDNEADGAAVEALFHDLDHTSSQAEARKSIKHFTHFMTPKAAKAVSDHYTSKMIAKRWKK